MGSLFENLYDVLFQPKVGMKNISEEKHVGQAVSVFFCSMLIPIWALSFSFKDVGSSMMIPMMAFIKVIASLGIWVMGVAVWHLVAEFFGGRGTAVGLFVSFGFAHIPRIFMIPLWALACVMPGNGKTAVLAISVLLLVFWSLYLDVIAIREVHQLSTAKSILVLIAPMLAIGLFCIMSVIFLGSAMFTIPM